MRKEWISILFSSLLIILFLYTGVIKATGRADFANGLSLSTWGVISNNSVLISWVWPYVEIIVAALLFFPRTRLIGFYLSAVFMTFLFLYVLIIVNSGHRLPCSCGGIIGYLGWKQHIYFNLAFAVMGVIGAFNERRPARPTFEGKTALV